MNVQGERLRCPICGSIVQLAECLPRWFPFCSRKCQLVDLGRWLNEEYSITRPLVESDQGEEPE